MSVTFVEDVIFLIGGDTEVCGQITAQGDTFFRL